MCRDSKTLSIPFWRGSSFLVIHLVNMTCQACQNVAKKLIYLDISSKQIVGMLSFQKIKILWKLEKIPFWKQILFQKKFK